MYRTNTPTYRTRYSNISAFKDFFTDPDTYVDIVDDEKETKSEKTYRIVDETSLTLENIDTMDQYTQNKNELTSYMFFSNLELIKKFVGEILEYDESVVNKILDDGHNWAEDHMSVAKENISHVRNYFTSELSDSQIVESYSGNYMFFGNCVVIQDMCDEILSLDKQKVDMLLIKKHDWAEDHISSAKENITQVYDFLKNEVK